MLHKKSDMSVPGRISRFIGGIAGVVLSVFGKGPGKPTAKDLRRVEFKTSTQGMGARFGDRIRNVFRFKWIRRASKPDDQ